MNKKQMWFIALAFLGVGTVSAQTYLGQFQP